MSPVLKSALWTVPLVVVLGSASGRLSNSGYGNRWFATLLRPDAMPPGWAFGVAWAILYVLLGIALALVLATSRGQERDRAVLWFAIQFGINLAWSPTFFALHQVTAALFVILAMLVAALITTFAFARVRPAAAWLMTPYLAWLCFAAALNNDFRRLNPDAEALVPEVASLQLSD